MAAEILTQPTNYHTEGSTSFAELGVLYGEKAVAEAQARLQIVLEFKSIRPKTVHLNGRRVPSLAIKELARKAGVSLGTLWRWYRLYGLAYGAARGNVHLKAKAGFEALIPRQRGRTEDSCEDRRLCVFSTFEITDALTEAMVRCPVHPVVEPDCTGTAGRWSAVFAPPFV